jgi:hypothetical protein
MDLAITRTRSRRRARGVVVAAVAAASLAVAGCGGGGTSTGAGAAGVAAFVPAGTPVYFEFSTAADGAQWRQAIALAQRFPGYGKAISRLTGDLASEGIDFANEVKPLLGSAGAVGVFDIRGFGSKDKVSALVALDLADGKDADVIKLIQSGKDPAKKVGEHDGVDLYGDQDAVIVVLDGTALFSDDRENVTRAIDAHRGGEAQTMAGSAKLDQAFADLPDEVLAQGFVDIGALLKIAESEGGADVAKQIASSGIGADASLGVSVSAETDGVRVKAVGRSLGSAYGAGESFTPALLDHVPADALAYVGVKNLYSAGEKLIAQLGGQNPEVKKGLSQASLALPLLGINLDDIKGLTSLEHAIVVTKGAPTPGVVAALEVAEPAKAKATLDQLRKTAPALLGASGQKIPPFTAVELANGVSGWQSPIDPRAGVVYGVDGNLALIGTRPEAIKAVQAPASKLRDDAAFQAATRQMPSKVDSVLWVNGEELLPSLEALGVLKDAPKEALPNLRPLKNIAAWSTGGDTPTFEAFLTIK